LSCQVSCTKHAARTLHYDVRLELASALKSWTVPKGLPETVGVKRVAVAADDHAIDHIDFEGTISEGQHGAGKVEISEKGTLDLTKRAGGLAQARDDPEAKPGECGSQEHAEISLSKASSQPASER
jgi:DNA ligase D-like protein (predicted 3'-phosphoesterase)